MNKKQNDFAGEGWGYSVYTFCAKIMQFVNGSGEMRINNPWMDKRLQENGELFFNRVVEKKTIHIRGLAYNRAEEIKLGRWLRHKEVTKEKLIKEELTRTRKLVAGRHVLAIQDTTEINYQAHAGRVKGLGTVGNGTDLGLYLHPLLVVDAQTKACIGCGAIKTWMRYEGAANNYQKLPIEEKESYRWIETAAIGKETLKQAKRVTFLGDRENDIYEFLDRIPEERTDIITRVCRYNRCLSKGQSLSEHLDSLEEQGRVKITVPREVRQKRAEREAELSIKYSEVEIKKPAKCTDKLASEIVKLRVVEIKEINCPAAQEAIHWILFTTHAVDTVEDAQKIIEWYRERWNIEQVFRTMKLQGLDIESSQVEDGVNLTKLVVIALCAAIQIMQLVLAREGKTQQKISDVFTHDEQLLLALLLTTLEGKTALQKNPHAKDNLGWGSWIIARLGGWKGYKSEGPPGPITMGRGLTEFRSIYYGWKLTRDMYTE